MRLNQFFNEFDALSVEVTTTITILTHYDTFTTCSIPK